ncbi:hypothetical protein AOLI_G00047420 [Acnodon oligacanthus]
MVMRGGSIKAVGRSSANRAVKCEPLDKLSEQPLLFIMATENKGHFHSEKTDTLRHVLCRWRDSLSSSTQSEAAAAAVRLKETDTRTRTRTQVSSHSPPPAAPLSSPGPAGPHRSAALALVTVPVRG